MVVGVLSRAELEKWLEDKPVDLAQVIAVRTALRVFPLVLDVARLPDEEISLALKRELILQTFRANFISWAACNYPVYDMTVAASSAAFSSESSILAAFSASASIFADSAECAVYAASALADTSSSVALASAALAANASSWKGVSVDRAWLEQGQIDLIYQPLWLEIAPDKDVHVARFPVWAQKPLDQFNKHPDWGQKGEWQVILLWYRCQLPGFPNSEPRSAFGEQADLKIATQPDAFWEITKTRDAEQILREIARMTPVRFGGQYFMPDDVSESMENAINDLESDIQTVVENIEPQAPAAYRFEIRDGRIVAVPTADIASDPRGAQTLLDEARQKAQTLKERLDRSNAEPRVKRSVDGLLDALPHDIANLNEYLLRSRFRSIEADAKAYSEDEAELFPDAVASLIDLSETLKDLQSFYPKLRDMEAEVAAIDIPPAQIDDVLGLADNIVSAMDEVPEATDPSVSDVMLKLGEIPREEAALSVRQKRTAEYLLVVRNLTSTVLRGALDNAFTRASKRLGSDVYEKARPKIVDGVADGLGSMARPATVFAISGLVGAIWGPVFGIATAAAGFGKIERLLSLAEKWLKKQADGEDIFTTPGDGDDEAGGADR